MSRKIFAFVVSALFLGMVPVFAHAASQSFNESAYASYALHEAQSPNTVEADAWPPGSADNMQAYDWSGSGAVGTGALPSMTSSRSPAAPSREDVETGIAPYSRLDSHFNPFHPDQRPIDTAE